MNARRRVTLRRGLAGAALLLGGLAPFARDPTARSRPDPAAVRALDLAAELRADPAALRVVDLRSATAFAEGHLPRAERVAAAELATTVFPAGARVVLYAERDADARAALTSVRGAGVSARVLAGGFDAWAAEVLAPTLDPGADATERAHRAELSRYFGGVPRLAPAGSPRLDDRAAARARLGGRGC